MNTKLTLSIEEQVIEKAKEYAKRNGRSLSNIVEEYLKFLSKAKKTKQSEKYHPLVEELCGSIKIPEDKNYDEIIGEVVIEKYKNR